MLSRALGREAQHGNAWLCKTSHTLGCLCCTYGNLCQLGSIGHGGHSHIAHHQDTILTILRFLSDEQHGTAHTADARSALDNLQCRTERIACGAQRTGDLSVSFLSLDNHTTEIERILHQLTSFLDGHALALAQFSEQGSILFTLGVVLRIDDGGLVDMCQPPLGCQLMNLLRVTYQDKMSYIVGEHHVGCSQRPFFGSFWKHDALLVTLSALDDLLY